MNSASVPCACLRRLRVWKHSVLLNIFTNTFSPLLGSKVLNYKYAVWIRAKCKSVNNVLLVIKAAIYSALRKPFKINWQEPANRNQAENRLENFVWTKRSSLAYNGSHKVLTILTIDWRYLTQRSCFIKTSNIYSKLPYHLYYKETDTHNYLHHTSLHPNHCKQAILYSQSLRLHRICSDDDDFWS